MVGFGRLRVGSMALLALAGQACWSSGALADQYYLRDGKVVEAEILAATRNTVTLRIGGALRPIGFSEIERVVLGLEDGSEVSGVFLGWKDGTFELGLEDEVVHVADGLILEDVAAASKLVVPEQRPAADSSEGPASTLIAGLPEVSLKDGRVLPVEIVDMTGALLTARSPGGVTQQLALSEIEVLRFVDESGALVSGRLLDWSGGVYRVALSGEADGEVLAILTAEAAAGALEAADAAVLPESATLPGAASPGDNEQVGIGGPPPGTTDPDPNPDPGRYRIEARSAGVSEGGEAVIFEFTLDPPAERPLVILYAATEDTAKAGEDFEAKSGVITFAAGSTRAEVQVPLIDDGRGEKQEQFHLFLSGDPETIHFTQRQIPAIISDDD
ncbi:MAG: Calx-beta domain-containing protein [Geminicoccaceae bacterium]